ncbi:hypothetical protein C8R41DRAFT_808153 [Lentinula lateritia]|uniref:P-loop containing nucleoside triphosphate hydrolase protein n=1 Tax=Lentinula lateritia TaxID=40482 RepID=A0ABQ8VXJ1_9AGAR|nr:hypothetical protein C8R41DRAFT_808153 [Lentinula lateritia]
MFHPFDFPFPSSSSSSEAPLVLLVTDELASPADFVLVRFVVEGVRGGGGDGRLGLGLNPKVLILTVSGSITRWGSVLGKYVSTIRFVDVLSGSGLKGVYTIVETFLQERRGGIVILDDITTLDWAGYSSRAEVVRFCRALRGLCVRTGCVLVIRHHMDGVGEGLFGDLLKLCTYHMEVYPLGSGKSGGVGGEVALHQGPNATLKSRVNTRPRSKRLQYKLTDTSAIYFERGTTGL